MKLFKCLFSFLIILGFIASCTEDVDGENLYPEVNAEFSYAIDHLNRTVTFSNASTGAEDYLWDFGDGITSTEFNTTHVYESDGNYTATLTATNTIGTQGVISYEITIDINNVCDFEMSQTISSTDLNITFQNDPGFVSDGVEIEIVNNPNINDNNPSCQVAKVVRTEAHPYVNNQLNLDNKFDFTTNTGFRMKVYSPAAGSTIVFKLEDQADANINAEVQAQSTVANDWEEFEFYFGPENSNLYDKIVIFFDLGATNTNTFYFDDVAMAEIASPEIPLELPITFENDLVNYSFVDFGNAFATKIDNPDASGINTSATVAQVEKIAGAETWAGTLMQLAAPLDFTNGTEVRAKIWSPIAGATILFKLENADDTSILYEVEATTTTANAWEELSFDISGADTSQPFRNVVLFMDFGNVGDGSIFYFDDIRQVSSEPVLDFPIDFESDAIDYAFVDFGNAFSTRIQNPDVSGINTSNYVAQYEKVAGAETWAGSFLTLHDAINFNQGTTFKLKVWSPMQGAVVLMKFEHPTDGGIVHEVQAATTTSSAWEELTFDFSSVDTSQTFQKVVLFFDFGNTGDGSIYYFDDIIQE